MCSVNRLFDINFSEYLIYLKKGINNPVNKMTRTLPVEAVSKESCHQNKHEANGNPYHDSSHKPHHDNPHKR